MDGGSFFGVCVGCGGGLVEILLQFMVEFCSVEPIWGWGLEKKSEKIILNLCVS